MNNDEKERKNNAKWRKDRIFYLVIILISEYSILWVLDPVFLIFYLVPAKSTIFYLFAGRYTSTPFFQDFPSQMRTECGTHLNSDLQTRCHEV